jgi:hypothetical protein
LLPNVPRFAAYALVAFAVAAIGTALEPPIALVLTRSHPETGTTLSQICRMLLPHRTVVLLEPALVRDDLFFHSSLNNIRTFSEWEAQVRKLIACVPILVLDCRRETNHLRTELRLLTEANRPSRRTIFLCQSEDGVPPLLSTLQARTALGGLVTTEDCVHTALAMCVLALRLPERASTREV